MSDRARGPGSPIVAVVLLPFAANSFAFAARETVLLAGEFAAEGVVDVDGESVEIWEVQAVALGVVVRAVCQAVSVSAAC